jgi:hypothetical protein
MTKWIDPRFHLAFYEDDHCRVVGGRLNGLVVHDLQHPNGRRLVWYDELGDITTMPILGLLKVRFADLLAIDAAIAKNAKRTNSDDLEAELAHPEPDPEFVWLGVQRCRQSKNTADDPDLPVWALGESSSAHYPKQFGSLLRPGQATCLAGPRLLHSMTCRDPLNLIL